MIFNFNYYSNNSLFIEDLCLDHIIVIVKYYFIAKRWKNWI